MHPAGGAGKAQNGGRKGRRARSGAGGPRVDVGTAGVRAAGGVVGPRVDASATGVRGYGGAGGRRRPGPVARGVARLLIRVADAVTGLLGASPAAGRELISETDLRDLVAVNTRLDPMERLLIGEVLAAGARLVREVMVPRTKVDFLEAGLPLDRAAALARAATHSRFPVVDGTHDDVVGFVHLRDLLIRPDGDPATVVAELSREVKRFPGSKRILPALSEMRREGHHLAIVVDEYGGTAGIVTLEDLIEELIGEIHDEYDAPEPVPVGPGGGDFDGRLNLADFAECSGLVLPDGPYETLGGFLMAVLGRLPAIGDEVTVDVSQPGRHGSIEPGPRGVVNGSHGKATGDRAPAGRRRDRTGAAWLLRVQALDGRRVARVAVLPATYRALSGEGGRAGYPGP